MKTLIFSDLDGTFLNHNDYSFEAAKPALKIIQQKHIPLIFTTSKTKAEVIALQEKVGIIEPFITENGAALFIPKGYQDLDLEELEEYGGYKVVNFGKSYKEVLQFYEHNKKRFGMRGFSDMNVEDVIRLTDLDRANALLAKTRDFTEPVVLEDLSKLAELESEADKYDLKLTKGGRFYHLIAKKQDKGVAVKQTKILFEKLFHTSIRSIGLGDGKNDIAMFENVDQAIAIKNYHGEYVECDVANLQRSTFMGSKGFNEMVLKYV